jgi:hypothetical protein
MALIYDGYSIIEKILFAAPWAFPTSGPIEPEVPAWEAPKNIAKSAINTCDGSQPNSYLSALKLFWIINDAK